MRLSFIIIAYNEERAIGDALDSIFAQTELPRNYEVVVVNDGSRDATLEIMHTYAQRHPEMKVVDLQPNQGRGAARAAGVAAAKGKFLAFIDADIILPENWLTSCMQYMDEYDACAGTAVPDGDVTWIYNIFKLTPKITPHATAVTGSNGLYKRSVFSKVMFKPGKKDGEDVDLGHQMEAAGIRSTRANGLIVEHRETKAYLASLKWLYVSGIGATKQWYEHRELRLPDLSFIGFLLLFGFGVLASLLSAFSASIILYALCLLGLYVTATSLLHLGGKFFLGRAPLASLAAVFANDTLLLAYFSGRFIGLASPLHTKKITEPETKKVTVYFDYESTWGMPWQDEKYDLPQTTQRILDVLDKHHVTATFFVVGKIAETQPKVIQMIAQKGHAIGLHGYEHESLGKLTDSELATFDTQLAKAEAQITKLTGTKPTTFRSPYLMGPEFYTPELYNILTEHGYRSVSNREIRYQQELFHPKRLRVTHWLDKDNRFTQALMVLLNLRLLLTENISDKQGLSKFKANRHWLLNGSAPFKRDGLLEVPLYSPLDCDLLGLPKPDEQSSQELLTYTIEALVGGLNRRGEIYSLNFHDWIIGSQNRIEVLDEVLGRISTMPKTSIVSDSEALAAYQDLNLSGAAA